MNYQKNISDDIGNIGRSKDYEATYGTHKCARVTCAKTCHSIQTVKCRNQQARASERSFSTRKLRSSSRQHRHHSKQSIIRKAGKKIKQYELSMAIILSAENQACGEGHTLALQTRTLSPQTPKPSACPGSGSLPEPRKPDDSERTVTT